MVIVHLHISTRCPMVSMPDDFHGHHYSMMLYYMNTDVCSSGILCHACMDGIAITSLLVFFLYVCIDMVHTFINYPLLFYPYAIVLTY